jgi:hypothetical protein
MERHEIFDDLDNYLTKLNSFFSLTRDSSKQEIYSSFKKFSKSFNEFNSQTSTKIIQYLQYCYNPLSEISIIAGAFAEKDLKIKSKTKIELAFTESVLFYLSTVTTTYYKFYNETVGYLKDYIEGSDYISRFIKIQNRMKIWILLGFLSIPFAFLGLISILAIIIAILSIILFIYERFILSTKEIDKLKQVGNVLQDNGKNSLEKMILTQKKMEVASEFMTLKKHFISNEILIAFDKLIAGNALSSEELNYYAEEMIKNYKLFKAQFE